MEKGKVMSALFNIRPGETGEERFSNFREALPLKIARARRGFGGFITLDMGDPRAVDAVTGEDQWEWHLWVYSCDWDLYLDGARLLWRRESDTARANHILEKLEGEILMSVEHDEADDCFLLSFTGGFTLNIDPDFYGFDGEADLFMLFKHGERDVLSYSPKRRFYKAA